MCIAIKLKAPICYVHIGAFYRYCSMERLILIYFSFAQQAHKFNGICISVSALANYLLNNQLNNQLNN